jgi:2-methylisocitrate lyase-like PEP mutase family enzyme
MDLRQQFRQLHKSNFIMPNPWDLGSARILASLGFKALATTSAGFAATLGRPDGAVTRDEAIEHGRAIAAATPLPVSADLENGFGDTRKDVEETVLRASNSGLAGCSIEDFCPNSEPALYERDHAVDRIRAAVSAADRDPSPLVLTARA